MTSSIRIGQVFPELVGKKTHIIWKVYGEMLKCIINNALDLAHYGACFHINDDVKKCRHLSVKIIVYSFITHSNCFHMKYYKKYALPWIQ